jgi:hypothetical protein
MHHLILIAALAAATALGFLVFTNLLRNGDGAHVAESTIGTTAFLAAPILAFHSHGWASALITAAVALGIYAMIRLSVPPAYLQRAAPWASATLLLVCLPYVN